MNDGVDCPNDSHCFGCCDYTKKGDHAGDPHCPSCGTAQHRARIAAGVYD